MKIERILIPTDFSETGMLAVKHAAFMAGLFKADLFLLHVIEVTETTYSIYDPAVQIRDLKAIQDIVEDRLGKLADDIRKEYGVQVKTICSSGRTAHEIADEVKENNIDIVIMGTHGAQGFQEYFIGSNAFKTVSLVPCPVITVRSHATHLGFENIVVPIDNRLHSRQKIDNVIALAKKYSAKVHLLGLIDTNDKVERNKFEIKLDAAENVLKKEGIIYTRETVEGKNTALEAMKYSDKVKADLIVVLSGDESDYDGIFSAVFTHRIVNHSSVPVMSVRPHEGVFEFIDLSAQLPFTG